MKESDKKKKKTISNVTWGDFHLLVKEGTQSVNVQILLYTCSGGGRSSNVSSITQLLKTQRASDVTAGTRCWKDLKPVYQKRKYQLLVDDNKKMLEDDVNVISSVMLHHQSQPVTSV